MENSFLYAIPYRELRHWAGAGYTVPDVTGGRYRYVKIGSFLKRVKEPVTILDGEEYKRAKIKLENGGIFLRDRLLGEEIGTKKQYLIREGQLLLSKIDARNGAFGIVPKELEGGVITGNFWVYEIDRSVILPQFLTKILSGDRFQKIWDVCSNGTTNRHYLREDAFLNTRVPLPSLEEQQNILAEYNRLVECARELYLKCDYRVLENRIGADLRLDETAGGERAAFLDRMNFSKLNSWDVRDRAKSSIFHSGKYEQVLLSQVACVNPPVAIGLPADADVTFLPMECISETDGCIKERRTCKASAGGFTRFREGDIIWAKITPCMQNGKSAVASGLTNGIGYGSTEFYVLRADETHITTRFLYYLLRTYRLRESAVGYFTGSAGQQRVRKSFLEELAIPLPSIEEQNRLTEEWDRIRDGIIAARETALALERTALEEFDRAVFGTPTEVEG